MGSINVVGARRFLTVAKAAIASQSAQSGPFSRLREKVAAKLPEGGPLELNSSTRNARRSPLPPLRGPPSPAGGRRTLTANFAQAGTGFLAAAQLSTGIDSKYSAAATIQTNPTKYGLLQK